MGLSEVVWLFDDTARAGMGTRARQEAQMMGAVRAVAVTAAAAGAAVPAEATEGAVRAAAEREAAAARPSSLRST